MRGANQNPRSLLQLPEGTWQRFVDLLMALEAQPRMPLCWAHTVVLRPKPCGTDGQTLVATHRNPSPFARRLADCGGGTSSILSRGCCQTMRLFGLAPVWVSDVSCQSPVCSKPTRQTACGSKDQESGTPGCCVRTTKTEICIPRKITWIFASGGPPFVCNPEPLTAETSTCAFASTTAFWPLLT